MEDEKGQQEKKRLDILADIRKTASPGRRGGNSPYAQAMYDYYAEIVELQSEGFTMATICKYLESKSALPNGADEHSFRRAFRREADRRKRTRKHKETRRKDAPETKMPTNTTSASAAPAIKANLFPQVTAPIKPVAGLRVNPDNTFAIRPIDPDDLPDIETMR